MRRELRRYVHTTKNSPFVQYPGQSSGFQTGSARTRMIRRRRTELKPNPVQAEGVAMTETEERLMAAAAAMGVRATPNAG